MAPENVHSSSSSSVLTATPPTFSWTANGTSASLRNNDFTVRILSNNYASYIDISTTSTSLTLTTSQWNTILGWTGDTIHLTVFGYQTSSPLTGAYGQGYQDFTKPIYITSISSGNVTITGTYFNFSGTIAIPSSINGLPVTAIGIQAFKNQADITGIILPSTITTIGNRAFQFCYNLSYVEMLSTSVTRIEAYTFDTCSITSISFPNNLNYIGEGAFIRGGNISSIPTSVATLGDYAFANVSTTRLIIPTNVANIGYLAFKECSSLTIYTEFSTRPSTWNTSWNNSNRPVIWGCTLSSDKTYVVSFTKSASNPSNPTATNGITQPYRSGYSFGGWYTTSDYSGTQYMDVTAAPNGTLYAKWNKNSCVAEGTLITLADGSQVAVEDLTGEKLLLVWNLFTGTFDVAPILFIDSDPYTQYEIIHLFFSDGTEVKVISEHGFWDLDLNEYVFLRNDAAQYIGHWFNKQTQDGNGNMIWTAVQLVDVDIYTEYTTAWSPVTYGHLCYYVNGMLSMPGATEGLINIFEVDATTMQYDATSFAADIATYGLFIYEEFAEIIPIPEVIFEAFNGQYLKVSIGKGLITMDGLIALIERYADFFTEEDANIPDDQDDQNGHGNHNGQGNGNHHGHNNGNGNHNGHRRRGR